VSPSVAAQTRPADRLPGADARPEIAGDTVADVVADVVIDITGLTADLPVTALGWALRRARSGAQRRAGRRGGYQRGAGYQRVIG
jgi:hypothetical protein